MIGPLRAAAANQQGEVIAQLLCDWLHSNYVPKRTARWVTLYKLNHKNESWNLKNVMDTFRYSEIAPFGSRPIFCESENLLKGVWVLGYPGLGELFSRAKSSFQPESNVLGTTPGGCPRPYLTPFAELLMKCF